MHVMDHMKQGSGLHMLTNLLLLVLFPCAMLLLGVLFLHVSAPRHEADIVGEIIPGLSNMLRKTDD